MVLKYQTYYENDTCLGHTMQNKTIMYIVSSDIHNKSMYINKQRACCQYDKRFRIIEHAIQTGFFPPRTPEVYADSTIVCV